LGGRPGRPSLPRVAHAPDCAGAARRRAGGREGHASFDQTADTPQEAVMSEANTTTNHDEIRKWVEDRNGRPAMVRTKGEGGILRIDFGEPDEALEPVDWDEFFEIFDENNLAFLHQDKTNNGHLSRFNKFVEREG
jgi:hypothetical protein